VSQASSAKAVAGAERSTPPPRPPAISNVLADQIFGWLARAAATLTLLLLVGILL
jgi:phosphate transport system permease protein